MAPIQPSSRSRLWCRFFAGLSYLALISWVLCAVTERHFLTVFAAVVFGSLFCSGLALAWMTLWAVRKDSRLGQFGLGSLFFLTAFVALYCAAVRWVVIEIESNSTLPVRRDELFLPVAIGGLLASIVAVPLVAGMTESLLWFAVWTVRRPLIRRLLIKRRRRDP